jgi:hypothetical protein
MYFKTIFMMKPQTPANPQTLTIYYKKLRNSNRRPERDYFRNVKDPDKIISRRNALGIQKVLYGGKPYDITKHLKKYKYGTQEGEV